MRSRPPGSLQDDLTRSPLAGNADACFYGDDLAFRDGPTMSMAPCRKMIRSHHQHAKAPG